MKRFLVKEIEYFLIKNVFFITAAESELNLNTFICLYKY